MEIILLTDYNNSFYSSVQLGYSSMDISLLTKYFCEFGIELNIKKFSESDFINDDYNGKYILYTSSEDRNLYYKDYIEDILLGLKENGAILIPEFKYFRAHHNKVFMEILRHTNPNKALNTLHSQIFGTLEDMEHQIRTVPSVSVIKKSSGALSKGVLLAKDKSSLLKKAKKISMSPVMHDTITRTIFDFFITKHIFFLRKIKYFLEDVVKIKHKKNIYKNPVSRNRSKFIIQQFIANLDNDYKILIYGDKYYVLKRRNRDNDFRASGSGMFEWPVDLPKGLLDYAKVVYKSFNVPYISLDIGFDGKQFYVFEFQFMFFGNFTLEYSKFYFSQNGNTWQITYERPILEKEFSRSVSQYINKSY